MNNKRLIYLLMSLVFYVAGCTIAESFTEPWSTPSVSHSTEKRTGVKELWSMTDIYAIQDDFTPKMVADDGKIVLIGSLTRSSTVINLICLDGSNGRMIWQEPDAPFEKPGYLSSLTANSGDLYVGFGGVPSAKKYDLAKGDLLWFQSLEGRGQSYIYVLENQVQIPTDPFIFTVLDSESGQILRTMKGDDIFISTPEDTFLPWGKGMRAINTNTGNLLWEVDLDRELTLAPVFTDNIIYLRTGRGVGSAYAIERSTGKILWKTDNTIISNLALSTKNDSVYVLNQSGELWKIDSSSGEGEHIIEFTNTPFLINGPEAIVGGYELAYDNTENILYVLLGDSRQLFAFQMN